eukprot:s542_g1.t1
MSYSAADLEAACAVILAALEEGEDLAPFLQQLPATRAASTTPAPAPAPPVVPKAAGASACGGSSGSNEGGASSSAGPAVPEPSPEPPAAAASSQAQAQAQPAPWPLPPQRKQPPTVPADITGGQQPAQPAEIPAKAKPKGPPVALWESSGYMTEADARRAEELNFLTAEAFYHAMAAARAQKAAPPKKASFPPARPAPVAKTPAPDSAEMEALQLRIAGEIAAGASASSAAPAPECAGVGRVPHRPLPVGIEQIVPEEPGRRDTSAACHLRHPPDEVHDVVHEVVGGDIVRQDRGVVAGAPPIFTPA